MVNAHILPDSRLVNETLGSQMVDWEFGGKTVRIEVVPIFCANCGKAYGFVPKENTAFVCWMCRPCYERLGVVQGTYATPDEEFCKNVENEMLDRFGRALTDAELFALSEKNELGTALEKLAKESPYLVYRE